MVDLLYLVCSFGSLAFLSLVLFLYHYNILVYLIISLSLSLLLSPNVSYFGRDGIRLL